MLKTIQIQKVNLISYKSMLINWSLMERRYEDSVVSICCRSNIKSLRHLFYLNHFVLSVSLFTFISWLKMYKRIRQFNILCFLKWFFFQLRSLFFNPMMISIILIFSEADMTLPYIREVLKDTIMAFGILLMAYLTAFITYKAFTIYCQRSKIHTTNYKKLITA